MSVFKCKAEKEQGDGHIVLMDELQEANVLILVGGYLKLRQRDNDYCFSRRGAQDLLLFLLEWYGTVELLGKFLGDLGKCTGDFYDRFWTMAQERTIEKYKESEEYKEALEKEYQRGVRIGEANAGIDASMFYSKKTYRDGFKDGFVAGMEKA